MLLLYVVLFYIYKFYTLYVLKVQEHIMYQWIWVHSQYEILCVCVCVGGHTMCFVTISSFKAAL